MSKKMLIDATHTEETRVVVLTDDQIEELDVDTSTKKQIKGNIYLAKVIRVEPSLQAAFVDYGGSKHGFLPFTEIHPDYYRIPVADKEELKEQFKKKMQDIAEPEEKKDSDIDELIRQEEIRLPKAGVYKKYRIQEVIHQGQIMLVQAIKEERGNKGAALTTYISLAGRYSVLMANDGHGGGVSKKITGSENRKALKEIVEKLPIPEGMSVIIRTAGADRKKAEIKRDFDYLMKTWSDIREDTINSVAPKLIHQEGDIIRRSLRDVLTDDTDEILVDGLDVFKQIKEFMKYLMPNYVKKIKLHTGKKPLFVEYNVEEQLESVYNNVVQLKSGGYLVIDQTEALVAVDVNSGKAIKERDIEETALNTNLEACWALARQLKLRDLAGLVVIDFIDMAEPKNNAAIERTLREALSTDRAKIQVGKMSGFGLMEMSRQRLHSSMLESSYVPCPHCLGKGRVRTTESCAMRALHLLERAILNENRKELVLHLPPEIAFYILNNKRQNLSDLETKNEAKIIIVGNPNYINSMDISLEGGMLDVEAPIIEPKNDKKPSNPMHRKENFKVVKETHLKKKKGNQKESWWKKLVS